MPAPVRTVIWSVSSLAGAHRVIGAVAGRAGRNTIGISCAICAGRSQFVAPSFRTHGQANDGWNRWWPGLRWSWDVHGAPAAVVNVPTWPAGPGGAGLSERCRRRRRWLVLLESAFAVQCAGGSLWSEPNPCLRVWSNLPGLTCKEIRRRCLAGGQTLMPPSGMLRACLRMVPFVGWRSTRHHRNWIVKVRSHCYRFHPPRWCWWLYLLFMASARLLRALFGGVGGALQLGLVRRPWRWPLGWRCRVHCAPRCGCFWQAFSFVTALISPGGVSRATAHVVQPGTTRAEAGKRRIQCLAGLRWRAPAGGLWSPAPRRRSAHRQLNLPAATETAWTRDGVHSPAFMTAVCVNLKNGALTALPASSEYLIGLLSRLAAGALYGTVRICSGAAGQPAQRRLKSIGR